MLVPRLVSISGSVHSGKTTVSRLLAARMPNSLYLDGDLISALVGQSYSQGTPIDDLLPEVHKHITKLVKASLSNGLSIIVDFPFTDENRRGMENDLRQVKFEAKWFLLKPKIEKVLSPSETRPELNDWEIERIKYHYKSPLMDTTLAKVIDSTHQTPEETAKIIGEDL